MVHPSRGFAISRRMWRYLPNRTSGSLYDNRSTNELVQFTNSEMSWSNVSRRDATITANIRDETRTWKLPADLVGSNEPKTGYRIHETGGGVWEILNVSLRSAQHMYHCVTVKLMEHPD